MENKEDLIIGLQARLSEKFVSDYDLIKGALQDINNYLQVMDIEFTYNYDDFCKDFLTTSQAFIEKLAIDELKNMDTYVFTQEVIGIMIYYKIGETIKDEDDKKLKLLQHILIKKNS